MNDFKDVINVLSTPQILTSDNKEAEIVVGENVPFISKRESGITTTNSVLSSIERKDVGITLRITPQITEGDYVKLDIYQEISSLKQDSETILTSIGPSTTKRSTKTSVAVKDNQTVVISGLMQERDEESVTKLPILGDIPVLGFLFKQKTTSKTKTNLLVFLTPHIVKEADSLVQITKDKQKEFAASNNQYPKGELLLWFREGTPADTALSLISQRSASVMQFSEQDRSYRIKLKHGESVEKAVEEFLSLPEVLKAEPNYTFRTK
jgi:general secretion pathway protein D